jgi:hypothetical protein
MLRSLFAVTATATAVVLASCTTIGPPLAGFEATVRTDLVPKTTTVPYGKEITETVAASRDDRGVQSDFVEGIVLLRVQSDADLPAYLARFGGTVVRDNAIPEDLPAKFAVQLTPEQRKATRYYIRIDPARADLASLAANARAAGMQGRVEVSSELGLRTLATAAAARAAGFKVGGDFVYEFHQAFPQTLFSSSERPGATADAFAEAHYNSNANVSHAWQFVAAHGITRRMRVAIVDAGFWLDTSGRALGADSDFPPPPAVPMQFDRIANDLIADAPNPGKCSQNKTCFWHGTGSSGVAIGIMNNGKGFAGTGSQVGDPLLVKVSGTEAQVKDAIRVALVLGADVVSVSLGGSCDVWCRMDERDDTTFADSVNVGNRPVFVISAGNDNDYVGDPHFVHPCIEDHVICVGAVNDPSSTIPNNDLTKASYSNWGESVDIFAPSNIPVMSYPSSTDAAKNPLPIAQAYGPEVPQVFGGTSASAPFVAGIAAMMKSINPNLNSDDVAGILTATARPGVAPAALVVDALAAVQRAAQGVPIVNDRFEPNDTDLIATDLGSAPPYNQANLNIDTRDRDFFRFVVPGAAVGTIQLQYPRALGNLSIYDFHADSMRCANPVLASDLTVPGGNQRVLQYRLAGGSHVIGFAADAVNAYNFGISFVTAPVAPDGYEPNDNAAQAKSLYSVVATGRGVGRGSIAYSPRVTINATIHSATDVDFYIVQGAEVTLREQVLMGANPTLKVYGNESPINLQVSRLGPTKLGGGTLVANLSGAPCSKDALAVALESNVYYLVRVSGQPGSYVLSNDVSGAGRQIPQLVHDDVYNLLHPGDPVENPQPGVEQTFVLPGDREYSAVSSSDTRVHMKLIDARGTVVGEGVAGRQGGERLDLGSANVDAFYVLQVDRRDREAQAPTVALQWEPVQPVRSSDNLVRGGLGRSGRLDAGWRRAAANGRVKARFAASFGRAGLPDDIASVRLTFLDAAHKRIGALTLASPTELLRGEDLHRVPAEVRNSGILPTAVSDYVPKTTAAMRVDVIKRRGVSANSRGKGYADAIELTLVEWPK